MVVVVVVVELKERRIERKGGKGKEASRETKKVAVTNFDIAD